MALLILVAPAVVSSHDCGSLDDTGSTLAITGYSGPNGYDLQTNSSMGASHNTVLYNPTYVHAAGPPITSASSTTTATEPPSQSSLEAELLDDAEEIGPGEDEDEV